MRMPEILSISREDAEYDLLKSLTKDIDAITKQIRGIPQLKDHEIEEILDSKHHKIAIKTYA